MWFDFAIVALVLCALLFIPGYLVARAFGVPRAWSVCIAPILSISLICIVGQILAFAQVTATPILMVAPIVIIPAVFLVAARKRVSAISFPEINWWLPLIFLVMGIALATHLFIRQLPQPDSIFQAYDVKQHINFIQSFADAGRFSSLGACSYLSPADQAIDPNPHAGFYPAAWHCLCALAVLITGASTPLTINASMFVFCGIVYPLAMLAFIRAVFPDQKKVVAFGCVVACAFVAFPWALLVFGPVYPNVAGFATMPAVIALFINIFHTSNKTSQRLRLCVLLLIAVIGQALLHPNTLFTCAVILIPFCTYRIWQSCRKKKLGFARSIAAALAFIVFCAAIWCLCYKLPFLQDTVTHVWPPYTRILQEIVNILTQTYTMGFFYEIAAQIILGILVVIGFIKAVHTPSLRWVAVSYILTCLIIIVSATKCGDFKQLIAGFWYTDPMRLAAMASIAATPLAALGLTWIYDATFSLVKSYNDKQRKQTHSPKIAAVIVLAFLALNFMPALNMPGVHMQLTTDQQERCAAGEDIPANMHTTFGDYCTVFKEAYTVNAPLSDKERTFLEKVKEIVPDESVIINNPMDGSFLSYGISGIRVYYRSFVGFGGPGETDQSKIIRSALSEISSNIEVQNAVASIDAHYVIVLSQEGSDSSFINLRDNYDPALFPGISSITPETPGFTCVYQCEDMYLYKIDA